MVNRLKEARFKARMPQIRLWMKSGVHFSTLSRIECGYLTPTEAQKKKIAKALDVAVEWLFPNSD